MAVFRERDFWRHHAGVFSIAFLILTLSRSVGFISDFGSLLTVAVQSLVMVTVALPLQTGGALLGIHYLSERYSLRISSLIGCVAAALPSTAIAMAVIWLAGLVSVGENGTRREFFEWMKFAFPAATLLHATLGSMLWMVLSFPWWGQHLVERPSPSNPPPRAPAPTYKKVSSQDQLVEQNINRLSRAPEFLRRLSPQNAGTLWSLSSERHYVRIQTESGAELMLMRLADAIEQCRELDGIRIHRSHWVHRPGVDHVARKGGKLTVVMRNGNVLPVSRSHQSAVVNFMGGSVANES